MVVVKDVGEGVGETPSLLMFILPLLLFVGAEEEEPLVVLALAR